MLDLVRDIEAGDLARSRDLKLKGRAAFPLPADHPNDENHQRIFQFLNNLPRDFTSHVDAFSNSVFDQDKDSILGLVRAIVPYLMGSDMASVAAWETASKSDRVWLANHNLEPRALRGLLSKLMRRKLPFTEADLLALLIWLDAYECAGVDNGPIAAVLRAVEQYFANKVLPAPFRERLQSILASFDEPSAADRKVMAKLREMLGDAK